MPNHESKICPRCKSEFECKVSSITQCQCSSVFLSQDEQEYVNTRYDDCLCLSCLMEAKTECSISNHKKNIQQYLRH